MLSLPFVTDVIQRALQEDIGAGDVTTNSIISPGIIGKGVIRAKGAGIICGLEVASRVFCLLDEDVAMDALVEEGMSVEAGQELAVVRGSTSAILQGERVALNFLQRMSGIATMTHQFVQAVQGTNAWIVDTRKTVPGLRTLDKYAVRAGGGRNHRFGLYDGILIKDNHIQAAGGIRAAVELARARAPFGYRLEVEVDSIPQVQEAMDNKVDIIMLDNMTLAEMKRAVGMIDGRVLTEASGGVDLNTVRQVAETGVDFISIGRLTHSVQVVDISFILS